MSFSSPVPTKTREILTPFIPLVVLVGIIATASLLLRWLLGSAFPLLIATLILCFLTQPLFRLLEKRGVPRFFLLIFGFVLFFGGLAVVAFWLLPMIFQQLKDLLQALPQLVEQLLEKAQTASASLGIQIPIDVQDPLAYLRLHSQEILSSIAKPSFQLLSTFFTGSASALLWILQLFLVPIFFIYLSSDWEYMVAKVKGMVPPRFEAAIHKHMSSLTTVFVAYFRGQILVCGFLALVYSIGYAFIGVPFGFLVGLLGGLLSFIPYVGAAIAFGGAILLCLGYGLPVSTLALVIGLFLLAQTIESYFLTPRLVGKSVGLNPLLTIFTVIAGANVGGIIGMIVAIPIAAFLKIVCLEAYESLRHSELYSN